MRLGSKLTSEHKEKIRLAHKGKKRSSTHREAIRKAKLGKKRPESWRIKIIESNKNRIVSKETREKMRLSHLGEKSSLWKGGVCVENRLIRASMEYKLWRLSVFKRDNFTCVWCGKKDKTVQADHIKPFALFPELRFAIDNGRTLCEACHRTTDTWGGSYIYRKYYV